MTITSTPTGEVARAGSRPLRLVRSELLKIRTTNMWWWFALGALAWLLIATAFNMWYAYVALNDPETFGGGVDVDPLFHGANIYTSGQFLGLMFVMLIGIVMVTNEYYHQTATTTFLTTPHRTTVIVNKLVTAVLIGLGFAVATTAIDLISGWVFFSTQEHGLLLGEWEVQRAILLNVLAYAIWTVFGVGIGTLITSQLAATLIAAVAYVIGSQIAPLLFLLLSNLFDSDALYDWAVLIPSVASSVMTTGTGEADGAGVTVAWWVGALVLVGYAVVAGLVGVLITRRRDIS